jgi:cobalt-zinc-cadmium efflux system protein
MSAGPERHGGEGARRVHSGADARRLGVALALIVAFMVAEVVVASISGSLALLADAGHMLTDAGALGAAIVALRLAGRPAFGPWTYGLKRAEILSAAGNGVTLLVIGALIVFTAVQRLISPPPIAGVDMLVVAAAGVAVNVTAIWVLAGANRRSPNVRGAFRHILTDLYAFIGTAVAGLVILLTGDTRADAAASLLVAGLMAHAAWGLLRDTGRILLEAAPGDVDMSEVRRHMLASPGVRSVHDLHAWTLTSGVPVLSAHVVADDSALAESCGGGLLDQIQRCLEGHFDVEHCTIQLEPVSHGAHEAECHP